MASAEQVMAWPPSEPLSEPDLGAPFGEAEWCGSSFVLLSSARRNILNCIRCEYISVLRGGKIGLNPFLHNTVEASTLSVEA